MVSHVQCKSARIPWGTRGSQGLAQTISFKVLLAHQISEEPPATRLRRAAKHVDRLYRRRGSRA